MVGHTKEENLYKPSDEEVKFCAAQIENLELACLVSTDPAEQASFRKSIEALRKFSAGNYSPLRVKPYYIEGLEGDKMGRGHQHFDDAISNASSQKNEILFLLASTGKHRVAYWYNTNIHIVTDFQNDVPVRLSKRNIIAFVKANRQESRHDISHRLSAPAFASVGSVTATATLRKDRQLRSGSVLPALSQAQLEADLESPKSSVQIAYYDANDVSSLKEFLEKTDYMKPILAENQILILKNATDKNDMIAYRDKTGSLQLHEFSKNSSPETIADFFKKARNSTLESGESFQPSISNRQPSPVSVKRTPKPLPTQSSNQNSTSLQNTLSFKQRSAIQTISTALTSYKSTLEKEQEKKTNPCSFFAPPVNAVRFAFGVHYDQKHPAALKLTSWIAALLNSPVFDPENTALTLSSDDQKALKDGRLGALAKALAKECPAFKEALDAKPIAQTAPTRK